MYKKESQCESGSGGKRCGFSTKAQQLGVSCCTLSPGRVSKGCHRMLRDEESFKPLYFCPLVLTCTKSFVVLKEKEILYRIFQIRLSGFPISFLFFFLFVFYLKLIAAPLIYCTFISLLLLLTVSFLAHLPGSPTILGHHNNWTELFLNYWLFTTLKSYFNSLSF